MQCAVLRADHIVKVFVIHIRPPGMNVLPGLGAGIAGGKNAAALEDPLADPGRFVGAVRYHGFVFGVILAQFIATKGQGCAVVDIAGSDVNTKYETMLVSGGMRFVGKAFFVFSLVEHAAFRVGGGCHRFLLLWRLYRCHPGKAFSVSFPVSVHLIEQFFCIPLCLFGNCLLACFFRLALALIWVPSTKIASVSR